MQDKNEANLPRHVAVIPDGNRRWAKAKGRPAFFGHERGVKRGEEVMRVCFEKKIPHFTFWASSRSNLENRSREEVDFLYKLFGQMFAKVRRDPLIKKNGVRVRILGRWREYFPSKLLAAAEDLMETTRHHRDLNLTYLMGYNGTDEMLEAVLAIGRKKLPVTGETLKQHLWTRDLPPVDFLIRTGGEPHLSAGFMMWDIAEAQFYFTEKYWPDFNREEFQKALDEYAERGRRFGA